MLARRCSRTSFVRPGLIAASLAFIVMCSCKEQGAPTPPPRKAEVQTEGADPSQPPAPPNPAPNPPPAKALEPQPDEAGLEQLTQLTFTARVDAPRFMPAALSGGRADGLAFLVRKDGGNHIQAVDLEGRPLALPLSPDAPQEFAVDARGWVVAISDQSGITTGARRLPESGELQVYDQGGKASLLLEAPSFQGFPDLDPKGERIAYVSVLDGDPELSLRQRDGETKPERLTRARGMDARPRFTPDGQSLVWSASRPQGKAQHDAWSSFERDGSVPPLVTEIWTMRLDDRQPRRLTDLGAHSFAPVPFADGVIFTSDAQDPKRRDFDLYYLGPGDDTPRRLTFARGFDGLATPLPDGRLAFVSERSGGEPQLFVASISLAH